MTAAVPLASPPFREPSMSRTWLRKWHGAQRTPPPEPPEPGTVFGVVKARGTTWTIQCGEDRGRDWFALDVVRVSTPPGAAARRRAGTRRRWRLHWCNYRERLTETPDALLLAFRLPEVVQRVQAAMLGRMF